MEIPNFEFFIDREKSKPCLVAGNAPSIVNFPFDSFKGVYILCNEGPRSLKKHILPDYWVSANYDFPVPQKHLRVINSFKDCTFIFADSAAYWRRHTYDYEFLKKKIKIPWFSFDDRHFSHKKCQPLQDCCKLVDLYPDRITLQEFFEQYIGTQDMRQGPGTVISYSLMFAIIMGCSPIYLQGVELPLYLKDYVHYNPPFRQRIQDIRLISKTYIEKWLYGKDNAHFSQNLQPTINYFESMADICHKRGIEIYNLSPTSTLNRVKSLPYLDYRKVRR